MLRILADDDVHPVGVHEKYTVGSTLSMVEVDGMTAIKIFSSGNSTRVTVPERSNVVFCSQTKRVGVFAQAVEVRVFRKPGLEAEELAFEDEACAGCVEKDFAGLSAMDLECERAGRILELEHE